MDHDHHMDVALDEARRARDQGNPAVGSIIVRDGEVIGRGRNEVVSGLDPTAHAETVAIRDACRRLATTDLAGAVCYTTMEPCPMCCWAIVLSGIDRLVVGARYADVGSINLGDYRVERLIAMTRRHLEMVDGIRTDECLAVYR